MSARPDVRRALVVDELAESRARFRAALPAARWLVSEALDGESAAERALRELPDAIITTNQLPGLSGTQLCRLLASDARTRSIEVIVVGGSNDRGQEFWAQESGARAYVSQTDLPRLADILAELYPHAPRAARVVRAAHEPLAASVRLGHVLDRALFESSLSMKLRDVSACEQSVSDLFERTSAILARAMPLQWIGFVPASDETLCVRHHPMSITAPRDAATELHADQFVPVELYPDIACSRAAKRSTIELRTIARGRAQLGRLAISLARRRTADDFQTIALFVRELAHALTLASLIESTQQLALTDPLTGLGNRRSAANELRRYLAESSRYGTPLSVAVLDVDHFKRVNDTMGHDVGDMVLKAVARVIASEIDRSDLAVRWGGEEFLIVLPRATAQRALEACESIRQSVERGLAHAAVTISIGLASGGGPSSEHLVARADAAMYQAKREGRNRVCVADNGTPDAPARAPRAPPRGRRRGP